MTFAEFKLVTKGLLSSDFPLPTEDAEVKALLGMAYTYIVDRCQVLNLTTLDKSADIHRLGRGEYVIRTPELPETDESELEIDHALGYVAASLVASYLSEKKTAVHQSRANTAINSYNAKVDELIETYGDKNDN